MHEDILGAVAGGDEAEALGLVEPLDLSLDFVRHSDDCRAENCCGLEFFLFGGVVGLRMSVGSQVTLEFKQHDKKNERLIYMMDLARGWYFKGVKYCRVGTLIKEVWLVVGG